MAITAEPLAPTLGEATLIGAVGGMIVVFAVPFLDKLKIDDVVGAIPVHLFAGIWGTLIVAINTQSSFTNEAGVEVTRSVLGQLFIQAQSIVIVGVFVVVVSAVVWMILKTAFGIRVSQETEISGLDVAELGMEAYPDFTKG